MKKDEEYTIQDAFIREVDEDLKNDQLKKLWDKYGVFAVIFVVAALSLAVSYESIKAWYIKRAENWSDAYAVALNLQTMGKYDESLEAFNTVIDEKFGAFADLARMQRINVLLDAKQQDKAIEELKTLAFNQKFNPKLRDTALIKLASYAMEEKTYDEMKEMLAPIADDASNAWHSSALEILALSAIKNNDKETARSIYEQILQDHDISDGTKERASEILSVLQ
ncbi:MAG: tetratricopeptide repeat protein [Alphaproteobacteria bacterium]|nr:tetratricopeptide repeat protein [Alphaproteobacteria bacterium]